MPLIRYLDISNGLYLQDQIPYLLVDWSFGRKLVVHQMDRLTDRRHRRVSHLRQFQVKQNHVNQR